MYSDGTIQINVGCLNNSEAALPVLALLRERPVLGGLLQEKAKQLFPAFALGAWQERVEDVIAELDVALGGPQK